MVFLPVHGRDPAALFVAVAKLFHCSVSAAFFRLPKSLLMFFFVKCSYVSRLYFIILAIQTPLFAIRQLAAKKIGMKQGGIFGDNWIRNGVVPGAHRTYVILQFWTFCTDLCCSVLCLLSAVVATTPPAHLTLLVSVWFPRCAVSSN